MKKASFCFLFTILPLLLSARQYGGNLFFQRADSLLNTILTLYQVPKYGLLMETYPRNPKQQITYTANSDANLTQQEVSFLWPYSAMVSGCVSMYKISKADKYKELMDKQIKPGLDLYWDNTRKPACYQSYPTFAGKNDRYYDDNDWIALDCCDYYEATGKQEYLDKAIALHRYIYSGWSDELGGGIYWCEQKRTSKNTCSNAPATVLCLKLYKLTKDEKYLKQAEETYEWTKKNLRDPEDFVYWDNINLEGQIGYAKYTYNSGQMIQAGVLLYQITGKEAYLQDAQQTAKGAYEYFCRLQQTPKGEMRFYPDSPWFNVILFRGLKALYQTDHNPTYIKAMIDNADFAWRWTRDSNGLFSNDWSGNKSNQFKSLLENACMVELFAEISEL
ncbi:glycoside hydrolase family 76 protein [Bacteroides caecicola]|uniref:glycoside hydrolase family 76 protein n=1 Tax=Bacteroides caecicola TaxID=1462569 RepID=UPI0015B47476|nr:glycoside hydrolase family 76 protein [Bacteroides caecicola]MCL1624556.1 glycoside hydrolase family 76 protein [Bacteroides caecicola]